MPEVSSAPAAPHQRSLGASARAALIWSGSFTLLRDVAQFALMLILVRLLSPADYGAAALVQSIVGLFSIVSYSAFSMHALQIQDPKTIDWQAHFTAAAVINTVIFAIILLASLALTFSTTYRAVATPLATLGIVFLIEIPGTLRHRMLEANHDWKRYRLILAIGTLLGMGSGLAVAFMGGGVWALIVQPPMLGLPAAFDLFVLQKFRPDWTWSWERYREAAWFGMNRIAVGATARARPVAENSVMAGAFDLATLGIYTRAMGLAMLIVGRIGGVTTSSLHPVLTRASSGSPRFRRLADLTFRGVCWISVPTAVLLFMSSKEAVLLLYGPKWEAVVPLLKYAIVVVAIVSVSNAVGSLLLANQLANTILWLDVFSGVATVLLAVLLVPWGPEEYLLGLTILVAILLVVSIGMLVHHAGMSLSGVAYGLFPPLAAAAVSASVIVELQSHFAGLVGVAKLASSVLLFGPIYLIVLRVLFRSPLRELSEVAPGGAILRKLVFLPAVS